MQRYLPIDKKSNVDITQPIFYANYSGGIDAILANGSNAATFTSSRSASNPATYIDENGVMQKTETSDTPRYTSKYYDSTGLNTYGKKGVIIEGQQTNYLIHSIFDTDAGSGLATGWNDGGNKTGTVTHSLVDIASLFNIGTNVNAQRIQYTGIATDSGATVELVSNSTALGSFVQNDNVSVCFLAKGTLSGCIIKIKIVEYDGGVYKAESASADLTSSLSSTEFTKISFSSVISNLDTDNIKIAVSIQGLEENDTIDIQIANIQSEKNAYPTSHIPTTTAALTRNAEVLKYEIAGNRSAALESMIIKYAIFFPNNGADQTISHTDTKGRWIYYRNGQDATAIIPNATDSSDCKVLDLIDESWTAQTQKTIGYNIQQTSPYAAGFYNGVADGTNETTDNFTTPAWGTYFYVGCLSNGTLQLDGVIFETAFFDKVLTANQHKQGYLDKLNNIRN